MQVRSIANQWDSPLWKTVAPNAKHSHPEANGQEGGVLDVIRLDVAIADDAIMPRDTVSKREQQD